MRTESCFDCSFTALKKTKTVATHMLDFLLGKPDLLCVKLAAEFFGNIKQPMDLFLGRRRDTIGALKA